MDEEGKLTKTTNERMPRSLFETVHTNTTENQFLPLKKPYKDTSVFFLVFQGEKLLQPAENEKGPESGGRKPIQSI